MIQAERIRVVEPKLRDGELVDVPADGATMGEIVMRGNNVMKGYYNDPDSTATAFEGGWFHSGDLGVMHPDGYVELRDRAKDVVVSGGENISTVEVEQAVQAHDAVLEAAVIGVPDQKWGERPKAFVVLKPGRSLTEAELLQHVRTRIARYKTPREIEFLPELPKTSTGGKVRNSRCGRRSGRVRTRGSRGELLHSGHATARVRGVLLLRRHRSCGVPVGAAAPSRARACRSARPARPGTDCGRAADTAVRRRT
jgi:fatty-acyl-CoA synthase